MSSFNAEISLGTECYSYLTDVTFSPSFACFCVQENEWDGGNLSYFDSKNCPYKNKQTGR